MLLALSVPVAIRPRFDSVRRRRVKGSRTAGGNIDLNRKGKRMATVSDATPMGETPGSSHGEDPRRRDFLSIAALSFGGVGVYGDEA